MMYSSSNHGKNTGFFSFCKSFRKLLSQHWYGIGCYIFSIQRVCRIDVFRKQFLEQTPGFIGIIIILYGFVKIIIIVTGFFLGSFFKSSWDKPVVFANVIDFYVVSITVNCIQGFQLVVAEVIIQKHKWAIGILCSTCRFDIHSLYIFYSADILIQSLHLAFYLTLISLPQLFSEMSLIIRHGFVIKSEVFPKILSIFILKNFQPSNVNHLGMSVIKTNQLLVGSFFLC